MWKRISMIQATDENGNILGVESFKCGGRIYCKPSQIDLCITILTFPSEGAAVDKFWEITNTDDTEDTCMNSKTQNHVLGKHQLQRIKSDINDLIRLKSTDLTDSIEETLNASNYNARQELPKTIHQHYDVITKLFAILKELGAVECLDYSAFHTRQSHFEVKE